MSEIHDIWRQAALDNRPQFHGPAFTDRKWPVEDAHHDAQCAMSILPHRLLFSLVDGVDWACLVEGCDWILPTTAGSIVHLNNHHRWTWLDFANKFPDERLT